VPLEATMVCMDNSEWMRNGDYMPTRMDAQHDAANLVCGSKTQQNPESSVGVLTMAGGAVQVLCSPTDDMGKILTASSEVRIGGKCDFAAALQIAQLALKHRKNKNGGQRIVLFVGSPIEEDEKKLVKIGKQLKKANIAVDVVLMGESEINEPKISALIEAVNKNSNSHLVVVPQGVLPSDVLISSPVITGEEGGGGGGGSSAFNEYGGVDPNLDPELAIALRASMEEARADAERRAADSTTEASAAPNSVPADSGNMDEDDMLQQALMMSMMESEQASADTSAPSSDAGSSTNAAGFLDPGFVRGLLSGLPGVDINDPQIQAAMAAMANNESKDKEEEKKPKDK